MIDVCDSCSKNFKEAAGRLRERVLRAIILLPDPAVQTLAANHNQTTNMAAPISNIMAIYFGFTFAKWQQVETHRPSLYTVYGSKVLE